MFKKAAIWAGLGIAGALLGAWAVHFLGPHGKAPSCFNAPAFWACVEDKMREAGHL